MFRSSFAALVLIVGSISFGHVAGCALFQSADQANDPRVDSDLWLCRQQAGTQYQFDHDAGSAWALYDACVRDGGFR